MTSGNCSPMLRVLSSWMPSAFWKRAASSDCGTRRVRKLFSDVPRSDPRRPARPSSVTAPTVSSSERPKRCATGAACCSASAMSVTSPCDAMLAPASRSATCVASVPASSNVFRAPAMMFDAWPTSISAAAASWREPRAPSIESFNVRPAFDSVVIVAAASPAETPGSVMSAPRSFARSDTVFSCDSLAPAVTAKTLSCCSNLPVPKTTSSIAMESAAVAVVKPATAPPARRRFFASPVRPSRRLRFQAALDSRRRLRPEGRGVRPNADEGFGDFGHVFFFGFGGRTMPIAPSCAIAWRFAAPTSAGARSGPRMIRSTSRRCACVLPAWRYSYVTFGRALQDRVLRGLVLFG